MPVLGVLVGLAALTLAACPQESTLSVEVCSDLAPPSEIDGIRLVLLDDQHDRQLWSGFYSLINCEQNRVEQLPQRYDVPALSHPVWLVATGLLAGVEIVRVEVRVHGPLPTGQTTVPVSLLRDCLGQLACPLGQTCLGPDGCEGVPFFEDAPLPCAALPQPDVPDVPDAGAAQDAPSLDTDRDADDDTGPELLCPPPSNMGTP